MGLSTHIPARRRAIGMLIALTWLSIPGEVSADPIVRISVRVIHAKKAPPFLHDQVKPLWDMLRKSFGDRFAYYDLLVMKERELAKGARMTVPMPDGKTFEVLYRGISEDGRFLKLTIEHGDLKSRIRIHDGGLVFQAGTRFQGGVLIVGVRASAVPDL